MEVQVGAGPLRQPDPSCTPSGHRRSHPVRGIGETTSVPARTCRDAAPVCNGEHVEAMLTIPPSVRLRGRDTELRTLGAALDGARARRGTSLLLTGGPGTGKTALLDHVRADTDDFTVLSTAGVHDESDLPMAGLQRLLAPVEAAVGLLAEPRRGHVREALLHGIPGDRFVLGTGLLDLLTQTAEERPLLL